MVVKVVVVFVVKVSVQRIWTFRISLHNFAFELLICEIISRLISLRNYWRIILWKLAHDSPVPPSGLPHGIKSAGLACAPLRFGPPGRSAWSCLALSTRSTGSMWSSLFTSCSPRCPTAFVHGCHSCADALWDLYWGPLPCPCSSPSGQGFPRCILCGSGPPTGPCDPLASCASPHTLALRLPPSGASKPGWPWPLTWPLPTPSCLVQLFASGLPTTSVCPCLPLSNAAPTFQWVLGADVKSPWACTVTMYITALTAHACDGTTSSVAPGLPSSAEQVGTFTLNRTFLSSVVTPSVLTSSRWAPTGVTTVCDLQVTSTGDFALTTDPTLQTAAQTKARLYSTTPGGPLPDARRFIPLIHSADRCWLHETTLRFLHELCLQSAASTCPCDSPHWGPHFSSARHLMAAELGHCLAVANCQMHAVCGVLLAWASCSALSFSPF